MCRKERNQDGNSSPHPNYSPSIPDGQRAARQRVQDSPRRQAGVSRWCPVMASNVTLRTNLMLWLHAAFPGPSEVPWQQFSQLYWYQKGCQEGFHGPNVREMAQNMITCTTDRLQQLPVRGANWYPLVWNQDSQGQLLQHHNLKPHTKNAESSPVHTSVFWGLQRQRSAGFVLQLLTSASSTKAGNFSTERRLKTSHQTKPIQPRNSQLLESHVIPLLSH